MAKKKLDQLTLDVIQCEKDGYGCHYGRWKAAQPPKPQTPPELPEGWLICPQCGKWFKPTRRNSNQKFCNMYCQEQDASNRRKERRQQCKG